MTRQSRPTIVWVLAAAVCLMTHAVALGAAALQFERSGDDLSITAVDTDAGLSYWRLVLDENRGVITAFHDLTSPAGEDWNYASPYGYCSGLFAPVSIDIRNGSWDYAPGDAVDGQTSYVFTLSEPLADDQGTAVSTVTINAPSAEGTVISARTEYSYIQRATIAQKAGPEMDLHAADEAHMNALYVGTCQDDLNVDGTLWTQAEVADSPEAAALGLATGRTFRLTALNLTDGTLDYDSAYASTWHDSFEARFRVAGGIYDNYASKPPAGAVFNVYTRLDIDIVGDAQVANAAPVAAAGEDQTIIDIENDGTHDVSLDGSASYDNDGAIVAYGWTADGLPLATGPKPTVSLPVGTHTITLTVTDEKNASGTDDVIVTVVPRTPRTFYVDPGHPNASDANVGSDESAPLVTIAAATAQALNGDTIELKDGIYRERVGFASSGTPDAPITLKAGAGCRAVVAGSDELTGWNPLTADLARGNADYANIYYVDIDWLPNRLYEDETRLDYGRSPNHGWWVLGTGTAGTSLVDPTNLNAPDAVDWVGSTVFFRNLAPVSNSTIGVVGFDGATGTLTLESALPDTATPGTDLYYLFNKLELIDTPGEWAVEEIAPSTWRVYVWPSDSDTPDAHMYEATRRNGHLVGWGSQNYINIEGIEVRHGQLIGINDSYGIGSAGSGHHVTVSECIVHDNELNGFHLRGGSDITVRNCLVFNNGYGVGTSYSSNIRIANNEIHSNTVDGVIIGWYADNVVVEGNYVHDHVLWGHPDNGQLYREVTNISFIDNVMINAGQGVMMEEVDGVTYDNNVLVGSHAYMLIIGHGNCHNVTLNGNTLAFSGFGLINNTTGVGRTFHNNIYYQGHSNAMFSATEAMNYVADHNLFYLGDGLDGGRVISWNSQWLTWDSYQANCDQDANSQYADPLFANAPKLFDAMDATNLPFFRANRVYMRNGVSAHQVGDFVEMDFDGVVRTITAVDSDDQGGYIEYAPAHDAPLEIAGVVCNWRENDNFELDLSLQAASPAIGAGVGGRDIGSTVDVAAFRTCDFDGNGTRDVPVWPTGSIVEPPRKPGDADGDGTVDLRDFVILKTHFGSGTTWSEGDFDEDGDVDLADFVILKTHFGT